LPYGARAGVPIDQKFYLGGSNDVRGWPLRRISPRVSLCPEAPERCPGTPVGGKTMVHGSFELRVRAVADLWIASFADMGDVQENVATFDAAGLLYTTGGGLRYHSQVGIFRLDVGGQLNEDVRFPEPRRWAIHFGIGETF
jgi:translocation and assembly module TamA